MQQSWVSLLAASCRSFPEGSTLTAVVDPVTSAIVGSNGVDRALGVSDVREVTDQVLAGRNGELQHAMHAGVDYGWTAAISTPAGHFDGAGALLFGPGRDEAAIYLSATPVGEPEHESFEPVAVSTSTMVFSVYDSQMRTLFADPRLAAVGLEPNRYLGCHPWSTIHPYDLARANRLVQQLMAGAGLEVEFTARCAGPLGRWYNHQITLRRFVGEDDGFQAVFRALGAKRETIPPEMLTKRELELTADFYSGLRIPNIARRYDVSEKTIRNQLSSIYRKLEVGSGADMVLRYDPPDRLVHRQLGVRPIPLASDPSNEPTTALHERLSPS